MAGITITANGNSEWIAMPQNRNYRVTAEATTWGESTLVKLEHASESGLPIRAKTLDDSAEWSTGENEGRVISGPGRVRAVVSDYSGSAGLILRVEPTS
jgi:hypothetical protein